MKATVRQGKLIALAGIVGSGKTTTLRKTRGILAGEGEIIVAKDLSVEKARVTLSTLMMVLFYDLSTEGDLKTPNTTTLSQTKSELNYTNPDCYVQLR